MKVRVRVVAPFVLFATSLVIGIAALIAISHFRGSAARDGEAVRVLAEIRADANHLNAEEWRAIASGTVQVELLSPERAALRSSIARLNELGHRDDAERLTLAFTAYSDAVTDEFDLLNAGRVEEAERVDEERVDPGFEALQGQIATSTARIDAERIRADRDGSLASWAIGSIATAVILSLFMTYVRLRQRQATTQATHRALESQVVASQQLAAEREHEANHDALTGLPNRRYFFQRLAAVVDDCCEAIPAAVLLFDLNRFKDVNDTLGHHAGDDVLVDVGPRLQGALRSDDLLARLGGDEFAILVAGHADLTTETLDRMAQRIHRALDAPFLIDGLPLQISASVGIVLAPEHGDDAATLLQHADVAMYQAKATGTGTALYSPEVNPNSRDELQLTSELRRAFSRDELVLHYQPKLRLDSDEIIGVEALCRWQHPDRGLLFPDTFLRVIERSGMTRQLTSYVLNRALAQLRAWADDGIDLRVAVNLSAADLLDDTLPVEIAGLLERYGLLGSRLQLEVTENVFMAHPERVTSIISRLADHDVTLSLDDFGSGYSSLAHLRELSVEELKIDRGFVTNVVNDAFDTAVVRSTVGLAHSLALRVVAEGVETAETLTALREHGCDEAQGYYIRRPESAAVLTPWLRERTAHRVP